ncbi:MAG: c-type cytochrome [Porticoccaceae bacterium]
MALAIALVLLVVGSVLFHFLSPWWLTPIASNWTMIDDTIAITFWVTGFVFVTVNFFMAYVIVRYRHREDRTASYEPENKKLEWWLIGLTTVGVAAMLAPGLFVWAKIVDVPEDAAVVEVIGQQWHWSYRFPGDDGVLGTVHSRLVSDDNPFGMNPDDPAGQDDVLIASNELHLPLDQPVKLALRSKDVLHNFSVAQFRVKMDLVPGMVPYIWLTPTRTGRFDILCEELCGIAHYTMRGHVVVEPQETFDTWLHSYPTYAETLVSVPGNAAAGEAAYAVCATCHGAQGQGNAALNAPKLSGLDDWYMARQLKYFKTGVRGAHEDDTYGRQMAPMAMTLANDAAINNVVAYIATLPDKPAVKTIDQQVSQNGERLYRSCGACHGANGQGIQAMNAPRLAGMDDWYLATQLTNFKEGIRGSHAKDLYGPQMGLMASILAQDNAVNDMVSYLNTLGNSQ